MKIKGSDANMRSNKPPKKKIASRDNKYSVNYLP